MSPTSVSFVPSGLSLAHGHGGSSPTLFFQLSPLLSSLDPQTCLPLVSTWMSCRHIQFVLCDLPESVPCRLHSSLQWLLLPSGKVSALIQGMGLSVPTPCLMDPSSPTLQPFRASGLSGPHHPTHAPFCL